MTVAQAEIDITGVALSQTELSLAVGGTATLTASKVPSGATVETTVTWLSGDTSVVTVSDKGVVTAKAKGTAAILVKMTSSTGTVKTATCIVTVG